MHRSEIVSSELMDSAEALKRIETELHALRRKAEATGETMLAYLIEGAAGEARHARDRIVIRQRSDPG